MISPERLDLLQRQWVRLLEGFHVSPADAYPSFDRLVAAYSEPHRHYHTLEHLTEMFRVAGRLAGSCANPVAVQLAVWFHDAVCDPNASDNEERSAQFAIECLGELKLPAVTVAKVAELVRATAQGTGPAVTEDADTLVLIDADLAILGASEERYRRYAADIRNEYSFVPDDKYRHGRAEVLRQFLARPGLYRHPVMIAEGEAAARRNMEAELETLLRPMTG